MFTPLENEDILTIKKDEFMLLANLTKSDEDVKPIEFKGQSLVIKSPVFFEKKAWEFIWNGQSRNFKIEKES